MKAQRRGFNGTSANEEKASLLMSFDTHHLVCGASGVKRVNRQHDQHFEIIPLHELPSTFYFTEKQRRKLNELKRKQL